MTFNYGSKIYQGTRDEIRAKLASDLRKMPLTWNHGSWHLGQDSIQCDCPPSKAKGTLIGGILDQIPRGRTVEIEGNDIIITINGSIIKRVSIYDI